MYLVFMSLWLFIVEIFKVVQSWRQFPTKITMKDGPEVWEGQIVR